MSCVLAGGVLPGIEGLLLELDGFVDVSLELVDGELLLEPRVSDGAGDVAAMFAVLESVEEFFGGSAGLLQPASTAARPSAATVK